ncbi:hypothetical protein HDU97_003587 [Phlyctochytrium planicorne]|nr:hypothetical protein HDU97_003587 [Phlyctochytrium planicorne]
MTFQFVDVDDGARIAYQIINAQGNGIPLVMVSGLSSLPVDFGVLPTDLSKNRPVIILENRGLNNSKLPENVENDKAITVERMALDVLAVARKSLEEIETVRKSGKGSIKQFDLLGHSMGGFISLTLCCKVLKSIASPVTVRRLILIGTAAHTPESKLSSHLGPRDGESPKDMVERLMVLNLDENFKKSRPDDFKTVVNNAFQGKRSPAIIMAQAMATGRYNVADLLKDLTVPTMILHGTLDEIIDIKYGEFLANNIPNSVYVRMNGVGHMTMVYDPEVFANLVDGFLLRGNIGKSKI